jgi:hypothetical protein
LSAWTDYVTAALLGAGKAQPPPLPAALESALHASPPLEGEARFLTQAGALALWRRAGWQPARSETAVAPSEPEATALISRASAAHLRTMLGGRCAAVLPEWLREAARMGCHVPPELLPALLDRARQDRSLRPLAMAAGGRRAEWLATHNPDWTFATAESPELWESGSRDQRVAVLRVLRESDPAAARERVAAVWSAEPADVRTAFLTELETRLSDDDSPFLESTLDDRSKEVRRVAVDLLARLPSSPFVARMLSRAAPLLVFKRGGLLSKSTLEVTLPPAPDAAATRDGLDPKALGTQKTLGEKAVLLVLILSAVPLRHWTDTFQQTPAELLKAAGKTDFARALATGWAWAALRQRDAGWAEVLLEGSVQPHKELIPGEPLLTVLPEAARADRLASSLRAGGLANDKSAEWQAVAGQLAAWSGPLPLPLAREVLAALRRAAENGVPWHLRGIAETLLLRLPPALLPDALRGWPLDKDGVAGLVETLTFRHEALTALSEP